MEAAGRAMFDYETDALVAAARARPVACRLVGDLLWAEIDDERHLERARERVYPALLAAAREVR
jgi:2-aminoethylphosphonate-pyruvate transaminase